MLWTLMDKVDSIQEQMDNISRDVEILRKNQKELLEVKKNTVKEMKSTFGGFISKWIWIFLSKSLYWWTPQKAKKAKTEEKK